MQDRFKAIEQEYLRLRRQVQAGHLTTQQFHKALRRLTVEDAEGRTWMLGASSGQWYYYDGAEWIESDPFALRAIPVTRTAALRPAPRTSDTGESRLYLLGFAVISTLIFIVAAVLLLNFLVSPRGFTASAVGLETPGTDAVNGSNPSAQLTGIPADQPGATVLQGTPTRLSLFARTPLPTLTPNTPPPLVQATIRPVNPIVTPVSAPTQAIETIQSPDASVKPATPEPTVRATRVPTQAVPTPLPPPTQSPPTAPPAFPPGVYVNQMWVSPNAQRQQPVTFTASFLNTTGQAQSFEWRAVIFDPNKDGRNKDWGQSNPTGITVPPGNSQFSVTYIPVTNPGGCITLQALAASQREDNARIFFTTTDGSILAVNFQVC